MNELEQTLQKILEKSLTLAEQTGELVLEQAPDLLRQFFAWHTAEHAMGIIVGFLFIFIPYFLIKWVGSKEGDEYSIKIFNRYVDDEIGMSGIIGAIVSAIVGIAFIMINCYNLVYIIIAPKLYLIDYFL